MLAVWISWSAACSFCSWCLVLSILAALSIADFGLSRFLRGFRHGYVPVLGWLFLFCVHLPVAQSRQISALGVRFGEAAHPGPELNFRLCITNPTCVSNKFDTYADFLSQYRCDLVSLSETAATELVQKQLSAKFIAKKCKFLWSPPVMSLTETCGPVHTRGKASGVGILSALLCRQARLPLPHELEFSTRFVYGVVQMGDSHIQIVVLYCKPNRSSAEIEFNSRLMKHAVGQTRLIPLPYVIMGDFNMPVSSFESWPHLRASGCLTLTDLYPSLYAASMPPSCMDSTNPDNAILSPGLAPFVKSIRVLPQHMFAAHAPVIFDLRLPCQAIFLSRLRHPKSFVDLYLDDHAFEIPGVSECFQDVSSLQQWGEAVENCVDLALKVGDGNTSSLPKSFRGRCSPPKIVKCPVNSAIREACPGSYNPSTEVLTMATRRKVT